MTTRRARLTTYLADCARRPFAEGSHDCALFAAGAVQAMTGRDIAAEWRGRYISTRGGLRVLRRAGFADHIALAAHHFPVTHRPRIGDLAAVPTEQGPALGVVQGLHIYLLAESGLALVPLSAATQFFEV